ncbi:MAG: polysaccharide deacetylase [Spirochaetes bacterium]|nr:polysaccharide deacetylase [Spirochaetota bacterium]
MKQILCKWFSIVFTSMTIFTVTIIPVYAKIDSYMPYYALYTEPSHNGTYTRYIILRKFKYDSVLSYLYVNPDTLNTGILKHPQGSIAKDSFENIIHKCSNTQYAKLYLEALHKSKRTLNAGITHFNTNGIVITFDLCPSKRPIDSDFFSKFIKLNAHQHPIPVTICISGTWLLKHPEDFEWLKRLASTGKLDITWVNHSFTHFYSRKLPVKKNFMLKEGTSVSREVLQNEVCMLEHGIIPSVFFRFPGLISSQKIYEKVMGYGLIPLGADAWLAKGNYPVTGSIVLVHPNGNEKKGTRILLQLFQSGKLHNVVPLTAHSEIASYKSHVKLQLNNTYRIKDSL